MAADGGAETATNANAFRNIKSHVNSRSHRLIENFTRSAAITEKYDNWKRKMLTRYATINDYIYINVFDAKFAKIGGKFVATRPAPRFPTTANQIVIVPNRFPYDVDSRLRHYVLWHTTPNISAKVVNEILSVRFPNAKWVWYYSLGDSVPEIPHIHIFVGPAALN